MAYNNNSRNAQSKTSTAVEVVTPMTPEITDHFKPEVLEVVRNTFCKDATDAEFVLFAHKAATYKLDPFKNEIFFIKYGTTARIQFAHEAYLMKAREKDGFQPPNTQMVCEKDDFRIAADPQTGDMKIVKHEFGFPRGKIIGAYSIVRRDNYHPVTVFMDRSEIEHQFTGNNKDNWNKWTTDMFGKHVELRGLKKQYGLDFGDEESNQLPEYQNHIQQRKDITPEPEKIQEPETIVMDSEINVGEDLEPLRDEMTRKLAQLGKTTKPAIAEYFKENNITIDKTSRESYEAAIKMIDEDIELSDQALELDGDPL